MQDLYKKNIEALIQVDSTLGVSLFGIQENKRFEVFQGKDLLDINILDTLTNDFLYKNPVEELTNQVNTMHDVYARYPILFFYGIGNGLLLKALLQNESLKHLVVIEPNIELIYIALNFIDISEEILSQRVIIKLTDSLTFTNASKIMEKKHVKPYAKIYNLHSQTSYYERNYQDSMNDISNIFIRAYKHIVLAHGNDTMDALIGIEQHVANIEKMLRTYKTQDLFKKKISDVVVVVSTGPSLTKQLPLLKKYAPYITIISVDASLPILCKHNIVPDIVVSMERVVETASFFDNLDSEFLKNTYFVVSSLADLYTIHKLKNQKLILSMRPLSYMLYYDLDDFGYVGTGMSAANLAYQLAAFMEHKDIILIGQDLAYAKDGVSHAKGHKFIFNGKDRDKDTDLMVEAYGGDDLVKTTLIWNMFKNFFENDINEATTCCEITTYNSTEGGARIYGSVEKPFKDVLEDIVDTKKEKGIIKVRRVRKDVSAKLIKKAQEKTNYMLEYGLTLKKEVEKVFLKVTKECEHIDKIEKKDIDYDNILKLIDEIDIIKEKVETLEFSKMYIDTVQSYIYHQELDLAKLMVENSKTDEQKKEKLVKWLQIHRYWLFSLAGGINAQLFSVDRGLRLNELKKNEFKFLDSLINIDEEKIKNLYCKDAIGFLAIDNNLNDKDFVEYIKELYKRFPQVTFKAFYFNDEQKEFIKKIFKKEMCRFELIIPNDIYNLLNNIEIYIEKTINCINSLNTIISKYSSEVLVSSYNIEAINMEIGSLAKVNNNILLSTVLKEFNIPESTIKSNEYSFIPSLNNNFLEKNNIKYKVTNNMLYGNVVIDLLALGLKYKKYKKYAIKSLKFYYKNRGNF